MNFIILVFSNSLIYRGYKKLQYFFEQSYIFRFSSLFTRFVVHCYHQSYTHHYMHSNQSFFTPLFSRGLFTSFVPKLFSLVEFFAFLSKRLWKDTITEKVWSHVVTDCKKNYLGFLATLLYTALIIFSLLTLLFGKGFTRLEMLYVLAIIFVLFGLSLIKGDTSKYFTNSVIIKWLQTIYQ